MPKVDSRAYYNTLPHIDHECGDIWRDLPSFGLLGGAPCRGIVITPACDLSWQKSETLTYLPIVPINAFFTSDAAIPMVVEKVVVSIKQLGLTTGSNWTAKSYMLPPDHEVTSVITEIKSYEKTRQRTSKEISAISRIKSGLSIISALRSAHPSLDDNSDLKTLFGTEWDKLKERIVRNSASPALHFLPKDNQDEIFSGVPQHSVILFRYPITVPVRILNYAQETTEINWKRFLCSQPIPKVLKREFIKSRPVKMLSLRQSFLSDILTRYSALYNRIGSPDFTNETVQSFVAEVG